MVFNLIFANSTIHCFLLLLLIVDLHFLIPAVNAQIFNPTAADVMPVGIPNKKAKAKIESHTVIAEAKINLFVLLTHLFILFYLLK